MQQKRIGNTERAKRVGSVAETTAGPQGPTPTLKHGKDADNDSNFGDRKAHLVSSLATGLEKMREASSTGGSIPSRYSTPRPTVPDKLGEFPSLENDEYEEIDPQEASQSSGISGGSRSGVSLGKTAMATPPNTESSNINASGHTARRSTHEDHGHGHEQGQGKHRPGLWRRLRSNSGK